MSEEEKEVLKTFKNGLGLTRAEQEILVNYISKLQKELDLEKEGRKLILSAIQNNYISKDKIRELKQKLLEEGNNLTEEQRQKETEFRQGKLKAYEDLLEEDK